MSFEYLNVSLYFKRNFALNFEISVLWNILTIIFTMSSDIITIITEIQ